jgi:hypothetical protein
MPASSPAGRPTFDAVAPRSLRRRRAWLVLLAAGLPWSSGCAASAPPGDAVDGRWLSLEVVDRDGDDALRIWHHRGEAWVAGAPGERYALRVTNRSGERVLAVVSVDGVNIVTGETAGAQQRGYVLAPWQTALLTGWRKSDSEVAAFEFTRLPQSYAALTGRPGNVGVIGVAVFREAPRPIAVDVDRPPGEPPAPGERARDQAPPVPLADRGAPARTSPQAAGGTSTTAPATALPPQANPEAGTAAKDAAPAGAAGRARAPAEERLGTGHGARESSWVTMVPFERATTRPDDVLQLRYDRIDNLVAAGIVPRSYAAVVPWPPRPFPNDRNGIGFVPDPPSR